MSSIKSNIFYNSFLVMANYIFPLLVFPYISRVLGVTNIGICNFIDSVINYYCLFAMLGINSLAIREIAINKTNQYNLSKAFSSLLLLNIFVSSIVIIVLLLSIFLVPELYEYRKLLYIGVIKLIFQVMLIEWFYTGIEKFRYITLRSIFIRSIYVILVFLLVREPDDYFIYYLLLTLTIVFNSITNIIYSRKYVKFTFSGISVVKYIRPLFSLGVYNILTSFYTTFNVLFLGFNFPATEVGYYTTATKLHAIILAIFTAVSNVVMPRMASLIANNDKGNIIRLLKKTTQILFLIAFPIVLFCEVFAEDIILLIAGSGFEKSIVCFRIVIPLIFIVGYEQILVFQILVPAKKDKMVLLNALCASIIGIIANLILVPIFASLGSSLVWLVSESCVFFMASYFAKKTIGFSFPLKDFFMSIIKLLPILLILIFILLWKPIGMYSLFIGMLSIAIYYYCIEVLLLKNDIITNIINIKIK